MAMGIVVYLTEEQQAAIKPIIDRIKKMDDDGSPGMAVAQIYPDHIACGTLSSAKAAALRKAMGATNSKYTKTAQDRD